MTQQSFGISTSSRVIRPGEHITLWPHLKLARARQLAQGLWSSLEILSNGTPHGFDVEYSDDRRQATFLTRKQLSIPANEWSLVLGDIFHNFRSALDALAWELAHLDDASPSANHEKNIYFPIFKAEEHWARAVEGPLSSVPLDILDRLYAVQPFVADNVNEAILVILHDLDIADKHKALLKANFNFNVEAPIPYKYQFEDRFSDESHAVEEERLQTTSILPRQPVVRLTSTAPFEWVASDAPTPLRVTVQRGEDNYDAFQLIELIERQIEVTFSLVCTGLLPPGLPSKS